MRTGGPDLFATWGHFVHRRRWVVLAVSIVLLLGSGFVASQGGKLESGGFIETAESGRATKLIEKELPRAGGSTFTVIFSSGTLTATSAEFRAAVDAALKPLSSDPRLDSITTPYDATSTDPSRQISKDGHAITADIAVKDPIEVAREYYPELRAKVRSETLQVQATGVLAINNGFNGVLQDDLHRAEFVALPLALVLLVIVFGPIGAPLVPPGVGPVGGMERGGGLASNPIRAVAVGGTPSRPRSCDDRSPC